MVHIPKADFNLKTGKADPSRPRLTIGMACYDDFDGVYFSVQSLQLYHAEVMSDVEIIVVDNNPQSAAGQRVEKFITSWVSNGRYLAAADAVGTAAPRELVFREASGEYVVCIDSHVMIAAVPTASAAAR